MKYDVPWLILSTVILREAEFGRGKSLSCVTSKADDLHNNRPTTRNCNAEFVVL